MNLLNLINFFRRDREVSPALDLTEYRITTKANEYSGIIIHQDDVMIKFKSQAKKPVKILKSNIIHLQSISLKGNGR